MRKRLVSGMVAMGMMALAATAVHAAVNVPMYSFETGLQGFGPNGGGTTVALDTIGATDGVQSLKFAQVAGATFTAALTSNVVPPLDNPLLYSIGVDVTVPSSGYNGAWASLGVTVWGASQPNYPGGQQWGLQYQSTKEVAIPNAPGTYHFDIGLNGTNPLTFATNQSFGQVFGSAMDQLIPTGFQLFVNKPATDPLTVYFDNITGAVPEPASMAMLGLGTLALLRRRRS